MQWKKREILASFDWNMQGMGKQNSLFNILMDDTLTDDVQ